MTLCDLLRIVSITLEQGDNAQVIFETLNARGTPLLALDLVKNAVFHEAAREHLDVDASTSRSGSRSSMTTTGGRSSGRAGCYRPRADLFLMHWLTMKLRRITPATELFATFRKQILQAPSRRRWTELIRELCRDARTMREFDRKPPGSDEAVLPAPRRSRRHTGAPARMLLFREQELDDDRRLRALKILESWLVRRSLLRLTTKNYNAQMPALIGRVADDYRAPTRSCLKSCAPARGDQPLADRRGDHRLLETHDAYNNIAKPRLVMALSAVEQSLYSNKTDILAFPTRLSLEHVIPQSWQRHWPLADAETPEDEGRGARNPQRVDPSTRGT